MEVKEITVSRSVRVNTGNYEGTEHFVSMKAELDELDGTLSSTRDLSEKVDCAMLDQLCVAYKKRGKNLSRDQIAKQHGLNRG